MTTFLRTLPIVAVFALAGCTSAAPTRQFATAPAVMQPTIVEQPTTLPPREQTQIAMAMTDVSAFIAPEAMRLLGSGARGQAAGAQFNALEYGRPGAPRDWQGGDSASSGRVTVGPDLAVNNLRCRNFTHTVTISGTVYTRTGQACREPTAGWIVTTSTVG